MNKQELIEKYKRLEGVWDAPGAETARQIFLQDLEQIDEPQKVVVPQFVADWLKLSKNIGRSLFGAMRVFEKDGDVEKWLQWAENQELFARAWLFGYEVEKEKRYRISMPKARNHKNHAQILCEKDGKIFWCGEWYPFRTKFTRKELEAAGFGEVFNSTLFEVEEV
jgi:hypothetical protein